MTSPNRKTTDVNCKKVMQRLRSEHTYIGTLRQALAAEAAKLKRREDPDLVLLRDMMHYLMEYPDIHHHPLEDQVFAKLAKHSGGVRSDVIELLSEHKDLARESQYLYHKLDALILGDEKLQKSLLRLSLTDFLELYGEHVRLEETVVFPAAEALLTSEEWREIAQTLPSINDPVFGMSTGEQYARLRHRIADSADMAMARITASEILGIYSLIGAISAVAEGAEELSAFNRQQFRDFRKDNLAAYRDADSLSEAVRKAVKTNRRLLKKGWSKRLEIARKTARAAFLPASESLHVMDSFKRRS